MWGGKTALFLLKPLPSSSNKCCYISTEARTSHRFNTFEWLYVFMHLRLSAGEGQQSKTKKAKAKWKKKYLMDAPYLRLCSQQTAADELRKQWLAFVVISHALSKYLHSLRIAKMRRRQHRRLWKLFKLLPICHDMPCGMRHVAWGNCHWRLAPLALVGNSLKPGSCKLKFN